MKYCLSSPADRLIPAPNKLEYSLQLSSFLVTLQHWLHWNEVDCFTWNAIVDDYDVICLYSTNPLLGET
jgi:hypothetical protein